MRRAFAPCEGFFLRFNLKLVSAVLKVAFQESSSQKCLHLLESVLFGWITTWPALEFMGDGVEQQSQACCIQRDVNGAFGSVHLSTNSIRSILMPACAHR